MDGTNTTWDNSLIPTRIQREWDRTQKKRLLNKARKSFGIRIPGTINVTDMLTFTRSEALQEKLEMHASSGTLKRRLETLKTATEVGFVRSSNVELYKRALAFFGPH